jgi:aryl-alcohol dehydrogenase-like predicted oxidoreductase
MEYRLLGRSGLKVSTLAIGTMNYGRGDPSQPLFSLGVKEAKRNIDVCIDAGVNLIDTSDGYARGASEEVLGEALEGKRDNVLIASKVWNPMGEGPNDLGLSRHHVISACEASLRRLRTDHIDIYLAHKWDGMTPLDEVMEAFDSLIRSGKVRYIGCSNFSGWHVMKALSVAQRDHRERFVCQQIHYTLQAREAENELVPIAISEGLGILVWSPLAGGLLTGKFRRGETGPEGSRHFARKWKNPPIHDEDRLYDIVDTLVSIADARGASPAQVALAWLLGRPAVSSLIVGGRNEEQFRENLAAVELKLGEDELKQLEDVSRTKLLYPYWHQQFMGKERFGEADLALHRWHSDY